MSVKINSLELENVKRIHALQLTPAENGLTVIGGKNGQGKTSVLDAITYTLGGARYAPSSVTTETSTIPARMKVTLNNGIIVERSGPNSALTVTDPTGKRAGQTLLNSFVESLALDLPKFLESSDKDKATTLLKVAGIGSKLNELETKENDAYNKRRVIGQMATQKKKYADELPFFDGAPMDPVSITDLIKQQQAILAQNGENQRKRDRLKELESRHDSILSEIDRLTAELEKISADLEIAQMATEDLEDLSTTELENSIANAEAINNAVAANKARFAAYQEAGQLNTQYDALSDEIDKIRREKLDLLNNSKLPLPELSVDHGALTYRGMKWDCMSSSEQLIVATAIVRAINPKCGFVLIDKLEQLDSDSLKEFGQWAESEGLQIIATRVTTDSNDCTLIIEDGYAIGQEPQPAPVKPEVSTMPTFPAAPKKWTPGKF